MNSKRSYLDTLNAGRQRRPHTTLDELNRSLEQLEEQMGRSAGPREERYPRDYGRYAQNPAMDYGTRQPEPRYQPRDDYERSRQSAPRPMERSRAYDDGLSANARGIAGELKGLRDELRHQMTSGLRREFDALRKDIERAYQSGASAKDSAELGLEFERLSTAIQTLAERSDDKSVNLLRLELEQVKAAIETLARQETLLSVDRRWEDFDRRMSDFQERMSADVRQRQSDPAIAGLTERLEQISTAVNNLPESLSLRSLEEKMRTLSGAVDHFSRAGRGSQSFDLIEERLDEISRAIVASSVSAQAPNFDPEPFERIEARITSLARQIEEVADNRPGHEVIDRLNMLSDRVDQIAATTSVPHEAMDRLGRQIAAVAERIDRTPAALDTATIFRGIEERFDMLTGMIERRQGDAQEQANVLFRDLERRLDEVADRLDHPSAVATLDSSGIMSAIDQRFADFARKLDSRPSTQAPDAVLHGLESRLDAISKRLNTSAAAAPSIDTDVIRSLESQVAELSAHLSRPSVPTNGMKELAPRLDNIEKSIAGNRDSILEAARKAADEAVRALAGTQTESAAASGLAQDLKTLESLTRRSEERNAKTFEAIHDTLLKIVDRLGTLERPTPVVEERKLALDSTPPLDMDRPAPLPDVAETFGQRQAMPDRAARTPAEAAAAAAVAALDAEEDEQEEPAARRSLLGGLARALTGRKDRQELVLAGSSAVIEPDAPKIELDEPLDPKIANRPLEPGSGAPDINAILRRVRDERGQQPKPREADAAKADFIAAARRAAQAAAAEAEVLKRQSDSKGPSGSRMSGLFKARRKPILMAAAAIMLALAGLQLSKTFLSDPVDVAVSEPAPSLDIAPAPEPTAASNETAPAETVPETAEAPSAETPPVRVVEPKDAPVVEPAAPSDLVARAMPETLPANPELATTPPADQAPVQTPVAAEPAAEKPADPAAAQKIEVPADAGPLPLREAAEAGDSKALFEIATRYAEGRGVKEDMATAAKWYEKAAELGFAPAQYRIGNFYEKGIGVTRDLGKSKTWYQLAASQGNASAMHNLAVLFAMGTDGATDNDSAARWFIEAADLGVKDSQFNLGILSAKGVGMPQNLEESYKWFALVAKTGDRDAATKRDEVANSLRPEQLERARASVELWKPKALDPASNTVDIPESWQESPSKTASVDMKKAMVNIQRILNKNGYDAGKPDGVMGGKTKTAIAAFQKDNGMEATGEVDEKLVRALLERK